MIRPSLEFTIYRFHLYIRSKSLSTEWIRRETFSPKDSNFLRINPRNETTQLVSRVMTMIWSRAAPRHGGVKVATVAPIRPVFPPN